MGNSRHRFTTLDGIRGIAALAVMLYHLTQHSGFNRFAGATLSVDLFFCLSGFVLAHAYTERLRAGMGFGAFLLRRLIRLYPMYLAGALIGIVALVAKFESGETDLAAADIAGAAALNLLYLPYLGDFSIRFATGSVPAAVFPINDPAWSLFFELLINLVFAGLVLRSRRVPALALSVAGALWLAGYFLLTHQSVPGWSSVNFIGGLPRTMFTFFAGIAAYRLFALRPSGSPGLSPLLLSLAVITVLYLAGQGPVPHALTLLAIPVLVYAGARSRPRSVAGGRLMDWLGWLSYPLYCVHFPLYSLGTSIAGAAVPPLLVSAAVAPISIAAAVLIANGFDAPARRWLAARLLYRQPAASSG